LDSRLRNRLASIPKSSIVESINSARGLFRRAGAYANAVGIIEAANHKMKNRFIIPEQKRAHGILDLGTMKT
jgi:hypothetical protein